MFGDFHAASVGHAGKLVMGAEAIFAEVALSWRQTAPVSQYLRPGAPGGNAETMP